MKINNKVALITGAASGIGAAIAKAFAREGARVAVSDIDSERGQELVEKLLDYGHEAIFVAADVSRSEDVEHMVKDTLNRLSKIDILVNNAGIWSPGTVVTTDEERWDRIIATNLKSIFLVSKYVVPGMIEQEGGVIINMASVAGMVGATDASAYTASKGGVINLTRSMALDFAPNNIRVNVICPGLIESAMGDQVVGYYKPGEEPKHTKASWQPLYHIGSPEDIAPIAVYLASDDAAFTTGGVFVIDGGLTAQ